MIRNVIISNGFDVMIIRCGIRIAIINLCGSIVNVVLVVIVVVVVVVVACCS